MNTIGASRIKKVSPQFLVTDLDRSIDFYTNKLGFDLDFRHEDFYSGVVRDGHSIHLKVGKFSSRERQNKKKNEDLDIVVSVESIEELYKEYSEKSVAFAQPLREMPYGREFYVADPDGYLIGFLEERQTFYL